MISEVVWAKPEQLTARKEDGGKQEHEAQQRLQTQVDG